MRCACCDEILHEPKWNRDHEMWDYCLTCLEIIFSVFEDYPDEEAEEVDLVDPDEIDIESLDIQVLKNST